MNVCGDLLQVKWMLQRERNPKRIPDPTCSYHAAPAHAPASLQARLLASQMHLPPAERDAPLALVSGEVGEERWDVRGGLLCDEPGMGKTITAPHSRVPKQLQSFLNNSTPDSAKRRRGHQSALEAAKGAGEDAHPSGATLIVVPGTLVDHWAHQIDMHTREGIIRLHCISKASEMLPAARLAEFDVVLTTFDVLSKQWSQGSPSPGSNRWYKMHGESGKGSQSWRLGDSSKYKGVNQQEQKIKSGKDTQLYNVSELLRVRWRRVVLDEGHVMGSTCDSARAQGLLSFLGVHPWGHADFWRANMIAPFEEFQARAWVGLHALLSRIMIRSVKAEMERLGEIPRCTVTTTKSVKVEMERLGEIPRCITTTTKIELSSKERLAYNGLVTIMKRNILLSESGGLLSGLPVVTIIKRNILLSECGGSTVDSLLHKSNRKYAHEAISNARKACCVSGQFKIEIIAPAGVSRGHAERPLAA
ncbi:SNF2 family N-terminal domain-containing protein [Baffinella frigidus]|nr:SNF2 family N-terminal domain-containing protein [Cryptophyta sp. CCMP2293]